jgi:hypothetical protein
MLVRQIVDDRKFQQIVVIGSGPFEVTDIQASLLDL